MANIEKEVGDENQTVILLNSLRESFDKIRAVIKYGRDSLKLDVMLFSLRIKELDMRSCNKIMLGNGDALVANERSDKCENKNHRNNS